MKHYEFEKEEKYKLFRSVKEILHPTISKKNISDYKIIMKEELLPVRIFYPKKVSHLEDVLIFVHGECKITNCKGKYSDISNNFSREFDRLVISIDYNDEEEVEVIQKELFDTIQFIYDELLENSFDSTHITLVGDSTGATMLLNIVKDMNKNNIVVGKMLLFYPVLSGEYYGKTNYKSIEENCQIDHDLVRKLRNFYKKKNENNENVFPLKGKLNYQYPNMLFVIGGVDPLIDEAIDFSNKVDSCNYSIISFANHGFLGSKDKELQKEYNEIVKKFLLDE